jgi:hypothetical protein
MEDITTIIFGWHTIGIALVAYICTAVTRRIVETRWPGLKKQADELSASVTYGSNFAKWYQQVILYLMPLVYGGAAGVCAKFYPWPSGVHNWVSRMVLGIICGFFSGYAYKLIARLIGQKVGLDVSQIANSDPKPGQDG